jgi:hypothetical protein
MPKQKFPMPKTGRGGSKRKGGKAVAEGGQRPSPGEPHRFEPNNSSEAREFEGPCQLCGQPESDPIHQVDDQGQGQDKHQDDRWGASKGGW